MDREELIQNIIENMAKCQRPASFDGWQKIGVSHAQISMLFMLSYHKQLQIKQISQFLGITKSAASQMIDLLIKKGLVRRQIDAKDRRVAHLSLTPTGRSFLKKIQKAKFAGFRSRLATLSIDELKTLAAISQKLVIVPQENK